MAWSDNFDRADGPLGNGWTFNSGAATIVSSNARSEAYTLALNSNTNGTTYADATVTSINNVTGASISCPVVKGMAGGNHWFNGNIYLSQGLWYFAIEYNDNGAGTVVSTSRGSAPTGTVVTRLVYDEGHLSFYVNGDLMCEGDSARNAPYTLSGIRFPYYGPDVVSLFESADAPPPPYLTIEPQQVWFANPLNYLQATIHGADWSDVETPGTGLTADKGFITGSVLESDTIQSFQWSALVNTGTVTVTDPHTGAQGTFLSTFNPPQDSGQSWPLDEDGAGIVDRTGAFCPTGEILTTCHELEGVSGAKVLEGLAALADALGGMAGQTAPSHPIDGIPAKLWRAVNDSATLGVGPFTPGRDEPLATTLRLLYDSLGELRTVSAYTIQSVFDQLGGSPTLYSHADIIAALGNISPTDLTAVLNAIAAVRGSGNPSISSVMAQLAAIRNGGSNYTLGDLYDQLRAIRTPENLTLDHLVTLAVNNQADLLSFLEMMWRTIDADDDLINAIKASLDQMRAPFSRTLQNILDAIASNAEAIVLSIKNLGRAPIWPGLDGVTLGDPHDLQTTHTLVGPMHGVLVSIEGTDPGTGFYDYDTHRCWRNVGSLSFFNDLGAHEPFQLLGWSKGVYLPAKMSVASGVRTHLGRGPRGTITPFTID